MKSGCYHVYAVLIFIMASAQAQKRSLTIDDLWEFQHIEDYALSPDGDWIVISAARSQNDHENQDLYLITSQGGSARQLTAYPGYDGSPQWSPDGSLLAFISDRTGQRQIHVLPMDGGEAHPISQVKNGIQDFIWSPNGDYFAFTSWIDVSHKQTSDSLFLIGSTMKMIRRFPFHLEDEWQRNRHLHLFVMTYSGGTPWDITPGDYHSPSSHLGSHQDFTFSPNGKEIAFVRNIDSTWALSTNNDIYTVSAHGGTLRRISLNLGNDNQPVYSPRGKYIAYRSTRRPGHQYDQYDLMIYDRNSRHLTNMTTNFDLDVDEINWHPSGDHLFFTALDQSRIVIFSLDVKTKKIHGLLNSGHNRVLTVSPEGDRLFFIRSRINRPPEIYTCDIKGNGLRQLSFLNHAMLNEIEMNEAQDFWFPSFDGKLIHGFFIKPPFFDPAKTYPAILLIHQGPHDTWQDRFQKSWNAQMFASRGYVVVMINHRGSKGYGQNFSDAIIKNWGGPSYRDLMEGLAFIIREYPFIDKDNIASAGAFYGGYMVNWIAGHTQQFKCLVSHAGIFDLISYYGTTTELWLPEWEFDGTPYNNAKQYDKWSPIKFAHNFTTPTLVTHGALDDCVPVNQGLQMFTALQRHRVPSQYLHFYNEGHEIKNPANARLWWQTVLSWISQYTQEETP
ncbi:S9 family peptidase [bacterium]|nr:S9 family peptidase [bacterium]